MPAEFFLHHRVGEDALLDPAFGVGEELGEASRAAGTVGKDFVGAAAVLVALSPALMARFVCTFRQ